MTSARETREPEALLAGSETLHRMTAEDLLALFEREDHTLIGAVHGARAQIMELGRRMAHAIEEGGRIIYVGAGTSGRIGALDAAEWGPTFGIEPGRVFAVVAGGKRALSQAVEGAEDRRDEAVAALDEIDLGASDLVAGISASGTTPFVIAALERACEVGAARALITCIAPAHESAALPRAVSAHARDSAGAAPIGSPLLDPELLVVFLPTGAELVAGSTRLKAAAATHLALQRASLVCAVSSGWVYAGHMVEMRPTNQKLRRRAIRIIGELGAVSAERAAELLTAAAGDIKVALVCAVQNTGAEQARRRLAQADRRLDLLEGFA